jgi:hypothetical protein
MRDGELSIRCGGDALRLGTAAGSFVFLPRRRPHRFWAADRPPRLPQPRLSVQRIVSSRGGIQVARQRIQVGFGHAGQTVTIELGDTSMRVIDQHGELITTIPRTSTGEISRFKAYGTSRPQ